jgi:hypothetical protein
MLRWMLHLEVVCVVSRARRGTGASSGSGRAPGMLKQGANLCDGVALADALAIGTVVATRAQRIDICRGEASHLSLDSHARNPPYPRGHLLILRSISPSRSNEALHLSRPVGVANAVLRRCGAELTILGGEGARGGREGFGRLSQATGVMPDLDKYRFAVPQSLGCHLWPER